LGDVSKKQTFSPNVWATGQENKCFRQIHGQEKHKSSPQIQIWIILKSNWRCIKNTKFLNYLMNYVVQWQ